MKLTELPDFSFAGASFLSDLTQFLEQQKSDEVFTVDELAELLKYSGSHIRGVLRTHKTQKTLEEYCIKVKANTGRAQLLLGSKKAIVKLKELINAKKTH